MTKSYLLPINDSSRPTCRHYVRSICWRGEDCRFYHPPKNIPPVQLEISRQRGKCFCGSTFAVIPNKRRLTDENVDEPNFFVVCGRTKRSMKRCKSSSA